MSEVLAKKIKDVLINTCPAFTWRRAGAAIWHGCICSAKVGNPPCVCVWHETSECEAGKWPQLDFVDEYHLVQKNAADKMLNKAKTAIEAAEKNEQGGK